MQDLEPQTKYLRKNGGVYDLRSSNEMMQIILEKAANDERIRAVTMEGSRVNPNATRDEFCDFDICFIVTDVREFTRDKTWVRCFGEILIVQYPEDWYGQPYDYQSRERFAYLIQFEDGNRIDLSLIDLTHLEKERDNREPRLVLLNKDHFDALQPVQDESAFFISKPSYQEYYNTCNEFRWLSIYVSKGLCREEIYYAKYAYDVLMMPMFIKMMKWNIAKDHRFQITLGASNKYLKRYLSPQDMKHFQGIFPNGSYHDIWAKLFLFYDYFAELAESVAVALGFEFDQKETEAVRAFLWLRQEKYK